MAAEIMAQEICKNMQITRLFALFPKMPLFLRFGHNFTHLCPFKVGQKKKKKKMKHGLRNATQINRRFVRGKAISNRFKGRETGFNVQRASS